MYLAGRTAATLDEVAEEIRSAGGAVETAEVDALAEESVDRHADAVAAEAGGLDASFNAITHPHAHGVSMAEMDVDDFMAPVDVAARTTFLTMRAAARHMIPRRSGVVLAFGGPGTAAGPRGTTTWAAPRSRWTRSRRSVARRRWSSAATLNISAGAVID